MHAAIQRVGKDQYAITDGGSPIGTFVNGQRIQQAMLTPGSRIQIGSFQLVFLMKEGRSAVRPHDGRYSQPQNPYGNVQPGAPQNPYAPGPAQAPTGYGQPASPVSNQTVAYPGGVAAPVGVATLVVLDGPLAGQRFPLTTPIVLGRESPQVPMGYDTMSSRRHAQVMAGPAGVIVQDLGSTNGTFVNGTRVPTAPIRPGDVLKVGGTSFRIE